MFSNSKRNFLKIVGYLSLSSLIFSLQGKTFFKKNSNLIKKKLFNNLQNIGVIHRDPVRCAKFINNKYENLIEWWNDVKIQKEIKKIRNELFTEKKNYFTEIINELRK